MVEQLGRFAVVRDVLDQRGTDGLEKADGVTDAKRLIMRHRQREGL
jgi:hypothetical protein